MKYLFSPQRRLRYYAALGTAVLALLVMSVPSSASLLAQGGRDTTPRPRVTQMSNQWAVQLAPGADADAIAAQSGFVNAGPVGDGVYLFIAQGDNSVDSRRTLSLRSISGVLNAQQQERLPLAPRVITDPLLGDQWHLNNTGQETGMVAGEDANVFPAWDLGYDGTGIVVTSVDDGLWWDNPDLQPNYRADLSFDFEDGDNDPRKGSHGTAVGGIMAAADDSSACGVGVAYNAGLAGTVNPYNDAGDAGAMQYGLAEVDVYNQSWGPFDDGETMEAPGPLTNAAIQKGITQGRDGKGAIYVWAAGNGKLEDDNINADGWANDRRVIAVGASDFTGKSAWYSEPGAPMLVNAPSSGSSGGNSYGTTTTAPAGCTSGFGGTSSAAPLTAGVVALMLQANPDLTWRDVQAVLVASTDINDPSHTDWQTNDAGLQFNHSYGFGRVNAEKAVQTALTWTNLPPEIKTESAYLTVNGTFNENDENPLTSTINIPQDFVVEHVEIYVNALHKYRGDITISLESPGGTVSRMLEGRKNDTGVSNLVNWRMTSVANWGEMSAGDWKLSIWDDYVGAPTTGTLQSWKLVIHGHSAGGTPQELLVNGGFEADLDGWNLKFPIGDKVKANKPEKTIARTGDKAFKFKGNEGEVGKLVQKISGAPLASLLPGDQVTFSGWYNAKIEPGRFASVKIKYTDGTKTKLELSGTATGAYAPASQSALLTGTTEKIKVIVKYEQPTKKVFVDDLSLFIGALPTRAPLGLPGSDGQQPANDLLPMP